MRNFKRIIILCVFLAVCLVINAVLDYALIPNYFMRVSIHNIENNQYDDIFLGTSHGVAAIDPLTVDSVTGRKSTNICQGGEYLRDSYYFLKDACRNNKPKRVIYELDPGYWINPDIENPNYALSYYAMSCSLVKGEYFFAKIFSMDFRSVLFPWFQYREQIPNVQTNIKTKQSDAYKNYDIDAFDQSSTAYQNLCEEGFININRFEGEKANTNLVLWDETKILEDVPKYFDKLVQYCKENDIELVVITTPIPQETLAKYDTNYRSADKYFSKLMESYEIPYYNFNYMELEGMDRTVEGYADYDGHMFGDNAKIYSKLLGNILNSND